MPNVAANVASHALAAGSLPPVSLLEIQMVSGTRLFVATAPISVASLLGQFDAGGAPIASFLARMIDPPEFKSTGTLVTSTAHTTFENVGGDTVQRSGSLLFSKEQLWGALFAFRLWKAEAEYAYTTVIGNISDASVTDTTVELDLKSASNWSEISAPDCQINENCQNTFGSMQCGSTSATPCDNTYGTCSQLNRFKGVVPLWNNGSRYLPSNTQGLAQPVPSVQINLRRPA